MRQQIIWTDLTLAEIATHLAARGTAVSVTVVTQLLEQAGYVKRQAQKRQSTRQHPQRDQQFRRLAELRRHYEQSGNPIVSMDTKKKELIGNFYRDGKLYTLKELRTLDHDFPSLAEGVIIPHGLYDVQANRGHINLGVSHDTSRFACDSLKHYWQTVGVKDYSGAESIFLMCDGGGSNASNRYVFKAELQRVVNDLGVEIRVGHYPPGCSKHNPIEHRLFPHVTRACQGVIFISVELVQQLVRKTKTKTGLRVTVDILRGEYPTGEKAPSGFKEHMPLIFDEHLPTWNYRVLPQTRLQRR